MAWGWRCDTGCESWPDQLLYNTCLICGEKCTRFSNLRPLDKEEAEQYLKKALEEKRLAREKATRQAAFETFYDEHCRRIGIPTEGPLTVEQIAIMDNHA